MTKKLMIGVLVISLLLLLNLAFSGDKPLKVPETVNKDKVSSDCNCLGTDLTPPSAGQSLYMTKKRDCRWYCEYFYFPCFSGWCWDYECVWECNGLPTPR